MNRTGRTINERTSLLDASLALEAADLTGVPVLNDGGELTGYINLWDIMKGRRAGQMKAPVSAYMSKPAIFADGSITMHEVERIFYKHHIGHLPIMENQKIVGIVTRGDYLEYRKRKTI
jgi:tRNA nucleotidyltransferase (CCA-adding enzyme)